MIEPANAISMEQLSPELQRAARWVQQNAADVAMQSLRECARRADLSPSTFSRLARSLGFENFDALKKQCQHELQVTSGYSAKAQSLQDAAKGQSDWLQSLAQTQLENTTAVHREHNAKDLLRAARLLLSAPRVHILGTRASHSLALHLYYLYHMVASNAQLLNSHADMLSDHLLQCQAGDVLVAISFEPYTRTTVEAAQTAKQKHVKVLAITDSALSPLTTHAHQALYFHSGSPSYFQSTVGAMALLENLCAAVAIAGDKQALQQLHMMQQHMLQQSVYW